MRRVRETRMLGAGEGKPVSLLYRVNIFEILSLIMKSMLGIQLWIAAIILH